MSNNGIMETAEIEMVEEDALPASENDEAEALPETLRFPSGPAHTGGSLAARSGTAYRLYPARTGRVLTFDLHPLYASILSDGAIAKQGEVLGLDGDLRRALVAPFDGVIRLLVTGTGPSRHVKVFLTEQAERREHFAGRL